MRACSYVLCIYIYISGRRSIFTRNPWMGKPPRQRHIIMYRIGREKGFFYLNINFQCLSKLPPLPLRSQSIMIHIIIRRDRGIQWIVFNIMYIVFSSTRRGTGGRRSYRVGAWYIINKGGWRRSILCDAYIIMMCSCGIFVPGFSYGVKKRLGWTWFEKRIIL